MNKQKKYFMVGLTILLACIVLSACEQVVSIVTDDFEDETFELTAIDQAAIISMEDTLLTMLPMKRAKILNDGVSLGVILVGGGNDTVIAAIDTNGLEGIDIYNALISASCTQATASEISYAVSISEDSLAYRVLDATVAGTYVLYLDHHAAPSLFKEAGGSMALVEMESDNMSPELISGLYDLPGPIPVIKGRYEYNLEAGNYLFEIARLEATTKNDFRVVLMHE